MTQPPRRKGVWTAVFALLSAGLGAAILATDKNIWKDAPTHAYGLVLFVIVDLALVGYVFARANRTAFRLAAGWGALQVIVMLADAFNGPPTYGTPTQFATYLFGLGYYDSNHIAFLFPALFVINIILALVGFMESRKAYAASRITVPTTTVPTT